MASFWARPSAPASQRLPGTAGPAVPAGPAGTRGGFSGRNLLALSDNTMLMRQIEETHSPDIRAVDVKPIFSLVEDILKRAVPDPTLAIQAAQRPLEIEDRSQQVSFLTMLEHEAYTIDKVTSEIAHNALAQLDAHNTTIAVMRILSNYSWDAKAVLTMAAFALEYGEFWLLAQIYASNPLAKSMAILKQVHVLLEETTRMRTHFDALKELIEWLLQVTKCILEYHDLPFNYVNAKDLPAFEKGTKHLPAASYWIIRGVVACITQIIILTTAGHDYELSTTESMKLPTLTHQLQQVNKLLRDELDICYQIIEQKQMENTIEGLRQLFRQGHLDNMKSLNALVSTRHDSQPLVEGQTKKRVGLDVLWKKHVLLLITDLFNVNQDELAILEQINSEAKLQATRQHQQYEILWIPLADTSQWNDDMQKRFDTLQAPMPWYSVYHPRVTEKAVRKYIQEDWKFNGYDPILVLLDPFGKKITDNSKHMMWIWQSNAFPFSASREKELWEKESWRFELLVDNIDQLLLDWIREDKYILLYGGDNIDWVTRFVTAARNIAQQARVPIETAYVGKSTHGGRVQQLVSYIGERKLGYSWDNTTIWFFWKRIESMLYSKLQLRQTEATDPTVREIKRLLCYDKYSGWALLARGSKVLFIGDDHTVLTTFMDYDLWKDQIPVKGFDVAIVEYIRKTQGQQTTCTYYDFPYNASNIPDVFKCPECEYPMDRFTTVKCCHEKNYQATLY